MLTLSQAEIDALESDTQRLGILVRIATDPVARFWLGVGDFKPGINAYDAADETYSGLGQLIDVPALEQLINGVANRTTIHASGVPPETLAMASTEAGGVTGAAVAVGIVLFGPDWQQLGAPKWLNRSVADFVTLQQQSRGGKTTRAIELSVGSLFTGRRRRGFSYLTDRDQQSRHPGDRFCERTVMYSIGADKVWPTFAP